MLRIKEILVEKKVSEQELANRMGVTRQYINAIVKERSSCSLETLSRIASTLEVPIISLFEGYQQSVTNEKLVSILKIPDTNIVLRITMVV